MLLPTGVVKEAPIEPFREACAMNPWLMIVLRLFHLLFGAFWAGAAIYGALLLLPAIRESGPAGGAVAQALVRRKLPVWINVAAGLTILSGLVMYVGYIMASNGDWARGRPAMVYGLGAVFAIAAAGVAGAMVSPSAKKMGAVGARMAAAGGAPNAADLAEMQRLQARMHRGSRIGMVLVLLALACMAVARYL